MEGHLLMSSKERERLKVLARVKRGELNLKEAAELLSVSYRQCRRLHKRHQESGDRGLVHRSRGQPSNRGHGTKFKQAVLARYQERYPDFGPTLAAEKLALDGYQVDHETLRRWLVQARLWRKRRKRALHRSWRERRAHFGELVQLDGSHHEWFEKRAGRCCLMKLIDDATSKRMAHLSEEETIFSAMELLWQWIDRYGIPRALYTDKKNVYVVDEKTRARAAESGEEVLTQFGRACKKLGITIITAHSPQAKGRVERSHGTYQDRLVKELRLAKVNTIAAANELLVNGYGEQLSEKFAVAPRSTADYHRAAKGYDLAAIFCLEEERTLWKDWTVRFENQFFQLEAPNKTMLARGKVLVQRYLDGSLHFRYREQELAYTVLPERPQPITKQPKPKARSRPTGELERQKVVPAANHPWRNFLFGRGALLQRS
jgi:molybdenum-dependent DNA-binding transcriptional regulator ModE